MAPQPEPQLHLFSPDDARAKREAFKTMLPHYSLEAGAGYFGDGHVMEEDGWVEADGIGRIDERMFVCRTVGRFMEPTIRDGSYIVLRANPAAPQQSPSGWGSLRRRPTPASPREPGEGAPRPRRYAEAGSRIGLETIYMSAPRLLQRQARV